MTSRCDVDDPRAAAADGGCASSAHINAPPANTPTTQEKIEHRPAIPGNITRQAETFNTFTGVAPGPGRVQLGSVKWCSTTATRSVRRRRARSAAEPVPPEEEEPHQPNATA